MPVPSPVVPRGSQPSGADHPAARRVSGVAGRVRRAVGLRRALPLVGLLFAGAACFRPFNVRDYPTSVALFQAGMAKFEAGKWGDAASAFERLTLDLPARDTLLPKAQWYLGLARLKRTERLLAAQAFIKLSETFPDDSLADDALLKSGQVYVELWKTPALDPQYGLLAQTQFRLLVGVYPDSPLADSGTKALKDLDERFASKDYDTGMHYYRRKAFDSAILYFKDVVKNWPESERAKQAMLRMVEIYRLPFMKYDDDAREVCQALLGAYPEDAGVLAACKIDPADSTATAGRRPPAAG